MIAKEMQQALDLLRVATASQLPGHTLSVCVPETTPTMLPGPLSLVPAGREVCLDLHDSSQKRDLPSLWGLAIPLGFTPWNRWPVMGACDDVFHFFGTWGVLVDQLAGSGRGEAVWPSLCAAAQTEVGAWTGSHPKERRLQALLHLHGFQVGPVDGIIGPTTIAGLRAIGLGHGSIAEALAALEKKPPVEASKGSSIRQARFVLSDLPYQIHTFGSVRAKKDIKGAMVEIRGRGRIVIDIGAKGGGT